METDNIFHLNISGQIESAYFPIKADSKTIFCRYDIVSGPDWELISGLKSGVTQNSSAGNNSKKIVFNMPLEFTFKSTNPYGWPQIVFSLYGSNMWGTETSRGYARIHVPLCGSEHLFNAPIIVAKCSNMWAAAVSYVSDRSAELRDPKILAEGLKNKSLNTESYGELIIKLQSLSRGAENLGLQWGQQDNTNK